MHFSKLTRKLFLRRLDSFDWFCNIRVFPKVDLDDSGNIARIVLGLNFVFLFSRFDYNLVKISLTFAESLSTI